MDHLECRLLSGLEFPWLHGERDGGAVRGGVTRSTITLGTGSCRWEPAPPPTRASVKPPTSNSWRGRARAEPGAPASRGLSRRRQRIQSTPAIPGTTSPVIRRRPGGGRITAPTSRRSATAAPGYYKGAVPNGHAVIGDSCYTNAIQSHAVMCGQQTLVSYSGGRPEAGATAKHHQRRQPRVQRQRVGLAGRSTSKTSAA